MPMYYSDPARAEDPHALPDVEVFYRTEAACRADGWEGGAGWYWWFCQPGCLPSGDPMGPFGSEEEAVADMHRDCEEGWG